MNHPVDGKPATTYDPSDRSRDKREARLYRRFA
jgi:hypothetical protein